MPANKVVAGELISQREYARRRGVALYAVQRAISEGRIALVKGKIDPKKADVQWTENTRARADAPIPSSDDPKKPKKSADYFEARARREEAEADKSEFESALLAERLIELDRAEAAVFSTFRVFRDRLLATPRRLAPTLAGMTDIREIQFLIDDELRRALGVGEAATWLSVKAMLSARKF